MHIEPNSAHRKVSYFYNPTFGKIVYSKDHPMKPERVSMAHSLICTTGLYKKLDVYYGRHATKEEMTRFHAPEYIDFLEQYVAKDISNKIGNAFAPSLNINGIVNTYCSPVDRFDYPSDPHQRVDFLEKRQQYKVGESTDCPAFNGLFNLCQISTGASIDAAALILNGQTDIAINFSGGLHHAKKS